VVELATPGHHIALHHYAAEEPRWHAPVILCPGLGANRYNMDFFDDGVGRDRFSLARYLNATGFDVWILETRGRGWARVPRGSRWTVRDEVNEDVPTAIETVLDLTESSEVFWVGHSWGGLLQLLLQASTHPAAARVAGTIAMGTPGLFPRRGILNRLRRLDGFLGRPAALRLPLRAAARLALPWIGALNLASRWRWPHLAPLPTRLLRHLLATLAEDISPEIVRELRRWARLGHPADAEDGPVRWTGITSPLLLVAGTMDWIAPPEAMRPIADAAASSDVQLAVMGREGGYTHDFGHGGLILSEPAPDVVFPLVRSWLMQRAKPRA
jgi:predicted alpha/beta hydrolase